jgi:hypothetical protein
MQLSFISTLLAIAFALQAGCNRQAPVAAPPTTSMAVNAQLEAALAIMNPIQRDDALSAVAEAAADAGDGGIAMTAVVAIANPKLKDEAAVQSARKLAKAGKGAEATGIAKIIQNPITRDETLLELSKQ